MILDRIAHAPLYYPLGPRIRRAFKYLETAGLVTRPSGTYEIDGRNLYVVLSEYGTRPLDQGRWEAHRRYIDLQIVVKGVERIGYAPIDRLEQGSYDEGKDLLPCTGAGQFVTLHAGDFLLLFPHDGHMPGIAPDNPGPVKKAVFKILAEGM